jgi:hypothetical protein
MSVGASIRPVAGQIAPAGWWHKRHLIVSVEGGADDRSSLTGKR